LEVVDAMPGREGNNEPRFGQLIGFEPGTKKVARGGISDEEFEVWRSPLPNIDIRYNKNFTRKNSLQWEITPDARGYREATPDTIEGWPDLRELVKL
jgi:hypothetical protein